MSRQDYAICPRCGKEEHEAGRETDACVAELVMGWEYDGGVWYYQEDKGMIGLPEFSTSIADAWSVVEKMKDNDELASITCGDWRNGKWNSWVVQLQALGEGEAPTAPLAICRAALKIYGDKDGE